jgi:hypothetical protein
MLSFGTVQMRRIKLKRWLMKLHRQHPTPRKKRRLE